MQLAGTLDKPTRSFPILERRPGVLPESLPKLSLRQLRVFETVARLENVSGASKELLRSQPAVTSSILRLEQLLGVTLFERATTGTYPTAAGVTLAVRTRKILSGLERAISDVCGTGDASASLVASHVTRTQMLSLIAIADCGSFVAAARSIGISEASLQRAARMLEHVVGYQLYKHTAAGVTTTAIGRDLARRMNLVIDQIDSMTREIRQSDYPKERCIVVGVLLLEPTVLLTRAFRELNEQFSNTRLVVVSGGHDALLKKLNAGTLDFIVEILKGQDQHAGADVCEETLCRDRYCVVARRNHPLIARRSVMLEELRKYDWILPQHGSPRRVAFEHLFANGATPRASIETFSLSTIRLALLESDMLAILSWTEMLCERRIGALAAVPFEVPGDGPVIGITMRKEWKPNEIQGAFIDSLKRGALQLDNGGRFESGDVDFASAGRVAAVSGTR